MEREKENNNGNSILKKRESKSWVEKKNVPNSGKSLLETNTVWQRWVNINEIKSPRHHRNHQNDDGQHKSEPKSRFTHSLRRKRKSINFKWQTLIDLEKTISRYLSEGSDIRPTDDEIIEILKGKIPNQRAPDRYMVKHCPVGRVQRDLHSHHND